MDHYLLTALFAAALLCLVPRTTAAPPLTEGGDENSRGSQGSTDQPVASIEAIPSNDFTRFNVDIDIITLDEILEKVTVSQQLEGNQEDKKSKRTSSTCSTTIGAYGGRQGTAFVDISTNSCEVVITDIWIRHGAVVDSIQIQYNFSDDHQELRPQRGGNGGGSTHIPVNSGEIIIGVFGAVNQYRYITQMSILKLTSGNTAQIYGPFGTDYGNDTFVVFGDIKSIFGYHTSYLSAIGFFYKPW